MAKWIKFILVEKKPKTEVYKVESKEDSFVLGYIKWFPRWRKYAFFPTSDTVFEIICLSDIIQFLNRLMLKRNQRIINEKAFPKTEE